MQTSVLIASGTTAVSSASVLLNDGESATLTFIGKGKLMLVSVDDGGVELDDQRIDSSASRSVAISGPYRFKVRRAVCEEPVGMKMFKG